MALVKMTREVAEVKGGKTEGQFPEEVVETLKKTGWKVAGASDKKAETAKEEPKPVAKPKVEEAKAEELKVEPKVEKKEEKVEKPFKK